MENQPPDPQTIKPILTDLVGLLLQSIGENPWREGLEDTPMRYLKFWDEFVTQEPTFKMTTFSAEGYDQMIIQTDIPFYSICEHHLVPFFGMATVGYIPDQKIVGLSKIARTVDHFARKPQNQERLTTNVADFLIKHLDPLGCGVVVRARHLCMEMRGIKKPGTETITSCLRGVFFEQTVREEFIRLANL